MAGPIPASKAELLQTLEHRNGEIKNTVGDIYINTAKGILMKPPFAYSESISSDVADGIVNYGDKLMANAIAEDDDEGEILFNDVIPVMIYLTLKLNLGPICHWIYASQYTKTYWLTSGIIKKACLLCYKHHKLLESSSLK